MTFTVPGYRIEGLLGQGGQGQVWAARSLVDGERVALKRIPAGTPEAARVARSEAALLAALDHPNLIALRGFLVVRTDIVLVLELAGAGSLAALLGRRHRLAPAEVVATVSPVAAALAHAHASGILHGDVSPGNVLFTDTGRPKLADLGVARLLAADGPPTGTPGYLDPVLAAGGAAGAASDVFGLAAVALHALTGAGPWQLAGQLASAEQLLAVAATGQVVGLADRLAGLPRALADVLARTLDPDPHRRGTAADFALELREALPPERVWLTGDRGVRVSDPSIGGQRSGSGRAAGFGWGRRSGGRQEGFGWGRRRGGRQAVAVGRHSAQWAEANRAGAVGGIGRRESDHNPARLAADLTHVAIRPRPGPGPVAEAEPDRPSRLVGLAGRGNRWWRAPILAGAVLMLVVTGALTLGRFRHDAGSVAVGPARRATAASSAPPTDAAGILARLDRLRSAAYAQRRPELLEQVYRSASLLAADTAQLLRSVPAGCRLTGLDTDYRQLQASTAAGRLQIRTLASLPAGALACAGTVRGHTPAVGPVRLELTLSDTGSGYLLDGERLLDTAH